jgi:hypothetical protein
MNAMAEKLKEAGIDTVGARLTTACTEAIRRHPDSAMEAWRYVGAVFGHEFVRGLMDDMKGPPVTPTLNQEIEPGVESTLPTLSTYLARCEATRTSNTAFSQTYKPRVIPPERLEKRRELQRIVRSKYKNSGDVAWSDVGWHELHGLKRDGVEAKALLEASPAEVPNDGRSVGDVLGVKRVDEIIGEIRSRRS